MSCRWSFSSAALSVSNVSCVFRAPHSPVIQCSASNHTSLSDPCSVCLYMCLFVGTVASTFHCFTVFCRITPALETHIIIIVYWDLAAVRLD